MTIYYLMVKTHNTSGLKYLCQTSKQDPVTYNGSGIDWKQHLTENGNNVSTEILYQGPDREKMKLLGRYYSNLWDVVNSDQWANKIPETGGGSSPSEKTREILRRQQLGRKKPPRTKNHIEKIANALRGKPNPKTAAGLRKWYDSNPDRSAVLERQSKSLKEWYKANPKMAHEKSLKSWDSRYKKDYEKYKMAIIFIAEGKTNREISKLMQIDGATLTKLRSKSHRIFKLFPILIELMRS